MFIKTGTDYYNLSYVTRIIIEGDAIWVYFFDQDEPLMANTQESPLLFFPLRALIEHQLPLENLAEDFLDLAADLIDLDSVTKRLLDLEEPLHEIYRLDKHDLVKLVLTLDKQLKSSKKAHIRPLKG